MTVHQLWHPVDLFSGGRTWTALTSRSTFVAAAPPQITKRPRTNTVWGAFIMPGGYGAEGPATSGVAGGFPTLIPYSL